MGVIYKITNPKGRIYVGKTYCLRKRVSCHKCAAGKGSNIVLHNSIKKYGWENHTLEVIEEVDESLLNEREVFWIKELKTYCYENPGQMNMTLGGQGQRSTWGHNKKRVQHHSELFSGDKNPFFGKTHSDEAKKDMSEKATKRNKESGRLIPKWGVEKGRLIVRKPVIVYNSKGLFISKHTSLTQCAKDLGITHSSVKDSFNYNSWIDGEYLVKPYTENHSLIIQVDNVTIKTMARPVLCFIGSYMIEYPKAEIVANDLKIPTTTVRRAAQYNNARPIRTGHVFIYKDLYEKLKLVS